MTRVVCLQRRNGVVVQDADLYIGRECNKGGWNLPQSKWANPFHKWNSETVENAVARYEQYIRNKPELMAALPELQGKTLGCWCCNSDDPKDTRPCHGRVLLKLLEENASLRQTTE